MMKRPPRNSKLLIFKDQNEESSGKWVGHYLSTNCTNMMERLQLPPKGCQEIRENCVKVVKRDRTCRLFETDYVPISSSLGSNVAKKTNIVKTPIKIKGIYADWIDDVHDANQENKTIFYFTMLYFSFCSMITFNFICG